MIIFLSACKISNTTSNIPEGTGTTSSETVPYVVEHYKQNIDGSYSTTPSDIDNLTGTPNTLTNGKVNTYDALQYMKETIKE